MTIYRRILGLLLAVCLLAGMLVPGVSADSSTEAAQSRAAERLLEQCPSPGYGDEWTVFALQTSGTALPAAYLSGYAQSLRAVLAETGGVLSSTKATDYAAVILAVTAAGYDASSFGGWDLTAALRDQSFVTKQGVNGLIYALICLDYGGYPCSDREAYADALLGLQLSDGGWALSGTNADPDVTAMALQALAPYVLRVSVASAIEQGLACLAGLQRTDGSYASWGTVNCESGAQVLLALGELGISAGDSRFVKTGTLETALLRFRTSDGGFSHTQGGQAGTMATAQALLALCSLSRQAGGRASVYRSWNYGQSSGFTDLSGQICAAACLRVNQAGLMQGVSAAGFQPEGTLTRAMAVTILWRLAGSPAAGGTSSFTDIPAAAYYAKAALWGSRAGVVQGTGAGTFSPDQAVTRQELAVLLWRYTGTLGKSAAASGSLSGFSDGGMAADWAKTALSWAVGLDLLGGSTLSPTRSATRGETAQMLARWMEVYG